MRFIEAQITSETRGRNKQQIHNRFERSTKEYFQYWDRQYLRKLR